MSTITAKLFVPPNGRQREIEVTEILPEDADYLNQNGVKVSMETLSVGGEAIYFDDGKTLDDDPAEEPDEIIVLSLGKKSCKECFSEGVELLKSRASNA